MKRLILSVILAITGCFCSLNLWADKSSYNPVKIEIVANKLEHDETISTEQAADAVENILIAFSETESRGNKLLDAIPAGTDWEEFHLKFEAIEDEYHAAWVILKKFKNQKKLYAFKLLLSDNLYARFTIAWREYNKWYKGFAAKQKKFKDSPYEN